MKFKWLIKKLGGFPDVESAIEYIKTSPQKQEILSLAVQKLYKVIGPDDILRQEKDGTWMFMGKPMLQSEVTRLKEEAAFLKGMKLWQAIKLDIRYQLGKKIWEEARVPEDIVWGQLATYLDDIIRQRIKRMQ